MRPASALPLMLVLAAWAAPGLAADSYTLEPTHTFPSFEVRHHGVSMMRGKFNKSRGTAVLDEAGDGGGIEAIIDTRSVDTGLDDLNRILQGPLFLDSERFPEARFVSSQIDYQEGKPVRARGELTLRGITQPVSLEIRDFTCTTHFLSRRPLCGADARAVLRRSDFGMTFGGSLIGEEVALAIAVEGFRK